MTRYKQLFDELQRDFRDDEIKVRPATGKSPSLRYATARTFMNRLDEVLGPENWSDDFQVISDHSVICRLTINLPDGSKLTKSDAGGNAGMKDEGDDDKSGFSDAFKRACVKFGVGRHLYNDGMPTLRDAISVHGQPVASPATVSPVEPPWNHGTAGASPASPAEVVSPAIEPEPEPERLAAKAALGFWDHLNDRLKAANQQYFRDTGDENGCVDIRTAIKSVVDMTKRSGLHDHNPDQPRTMKQWRELIERIESGNPSNREFMDEYLRVHINIATETAILNHRKAVATSSDASTRGKR